jgi:hypothetical protein
MHYIVEINQRADGRWLWKAIAPNGHALVGGLEGDGYATPSAALRGLQDSARFFLRYGDALVEFSAEGQEIAGEIMKVDGEGRKPGVILRVHRHGEA